MKKEIITPQEAISKIKDGMTLMIGGFLGGGSPEILSMLWLRVTLRISPLLVMTPDFRIRE